jgi:HEAT repeat protein
MSDQRDKQSLSVLVGDLSSEDGMTREHARERLVGMGPQATASLVPLLTDERTQVRWEAAKALSEIADPASVPALVETLEDEEDDVSWLAAEGLAAIGKPSIVPLLRALVDGEATFLLRRGAHHVFSKLPDAESRDLVAPVHELLEGPYEDISVVMAAERLLEQLEENG